MCADDCHTYISHFEGKEAVSRNRFGIPWMIGFVGVIWAMWVPARSLRLPRYWASWFCGSGEGAGSQLLVPYSFYVLYQIQIKREVIPVCLSISKIALKPGKDSGGGGKGKSLAKWKVLRWFKELVLTEQGWLDLLWGPLGSLLLVVIFGAGKPACPKISLPAILPGSVIPTTRAIIQLKEHCISRRPGLQCSPP